LAPSEEAKVNINKCRAYLDTKMVTQSTPIYGINTGFGSLCNVKISNDNLSKLQENLVKSHAWGTEEVPYPYKIDVAIKNSIVKLRSFWNSLQTVERLIASISDVLPVIYTQGSLEPGDLAPLAHLSPYIT
jgi:histidine ammonia-lyase